MKRKHSHTQTICRQQLTNCLSVFDNFWGLAHKIFQDNDLGKLIEKARDIYRIHEHYFDKTLVNNDLDKTFDDFIQICNFLEQDPQWIYSSWVM